MSSTEVLPAPVLPAPPEDKWRREQRAFYRLLPELLRTHRDQFVAIHEEQVVESGEDKLEVAERAYARFGSTRFLGPKSTERPSSPTRIPSPRLIRDGSSA